MLRVPEEHAVALTAAIGKGAILAALEAPKGERDPGLSVAAVETVLAAITTAKAKGESRTRVAAITLRAQFDELEALTPGERHLLGELLDRISATK